MAEFEPAFDYMIGNEDYARTDPRFGQVHVDNNGYKVRFGVNAKYHQDLIESGFFDDMSVNEALKISMNLYQTNEWKIIQGDEINSQRIASKILDAAVNMGAKEAAKLIQRAVGVNADGAIGDITVGAINNGTEDVVLNDFVVWWNWFIGQEIRNKPQDSAYEKTWRIRADKLS